MNNLPIIDELNNFKKKNYIKFFMPGHSQLIEKRDFSDVQKEVFSILKKFEKNIFSFDITEVCDFDNLANPSGIIKKSEDILSKQIGAKRAYFLVNGSTVGVLSMISLIANSGDKIIIQKNSHKSVYNACKINNLKPVYINLKKNNKYDIYESIDENILINLIEDNKDAKAIVITSPDYYGNDENIKKIADIAHKNNMYLLVDSAHCANYIYSDKHSSFPLNLGADIVVTSFHKTLPTLNQTAILSVSDNISDEKCDKLQEKINIFQTTSPSYILLANIELTNYIMSKYGDILYQDLKKNIVWFKEKIGELSKLNILENDDFSRLVISFEDMNIQNIYSYIKEECNILPEMVNEKSIVLICNIFHTKSDFEKLYMGLESAYGIYCKKLNTTSDLKNIEAYKENDDIKKTYKKSENDKMQDEKSEKRLKKEQILLYLKENENKKSDKNIYSYPPGTPIITQDEIITDNHIRYIKSIIQNDDIDLIF